MAKSKSPHIIDAFNLLAAIVNDGKKYPIEQSKRGALDGLVSGYHTAGDDKTKAARDVMRAVNERKDFLRQFMPDLL